MIVLARLPLAALFLCLVTACAASADGGLPRPLRQALAEAGPNRAQVLAAWSGVPPIHRKGMAFLIENMPAADLRTLSAQYLRESVALAYAGLDQAPWKARIPDSLFLNDVLPYACLTETRDDSRKLLGQQSRPLIAGCRTPGEAAQRLNEKLFPLVKVHYSTERSRADQSPLESMASGIASCSGLSILLVDACRSVGIPARVAGTPMWWNNRGNHTWVEVWDNAWHFVGASEPDSHGLDHAWFSGDAAKARKNDPTYAIYASSFQKTGVAFPLVWAPDVRWVHAVNVTDRYASPVPAVAADQVRLLIKVLDAHGRRVAVNVTVTDAQNTSVSFSGVSRGASADRNNILGLDVPRGHAYDISVHYAGKSAHVRVTSGADEQQVVTVSLPAAQASRPHMSLDCAAKTPPAMVRLNVALAAYFAAPVDKEAHWTFPGALDRLLLTDEPAVRAAAWVAYKNAPIHQELQQEFEARQVRNGPYLSPYTLKTVGTRPPGGWALVIAMHGGGGAPKEVNDEQWQEMQIYYRDHPEVTGYKYLALRAPNDTWNGFYDDYVYPLVANLVRQQLLFSDVDPNKVFLIGYSHGGYGAFAIGPKEPDLFAAIHASAAAPTDGETTAVTLRHTPFSVMVGTEDTMYGRFDRDHKFADEVTKLRGDRTDIYPVTVDFEAGRHHSDLPDRDFLPQMLPLVRNPAPHDLSWLMTDSVITDFFWLHTDAPGKTKEIDAACRDNAVTVTTTPNVTSATLLLDSRLIDFRRPLTLTVNGKTTTRHVAPSLRTLCGTLQQRGDPDRAFTSALALPL